MHESPFNSSDFWVLTIYGIFMLSEFNAIYTVSKKRPTFVTFHILWIQYHVKHILKTSSIKKMGRRYNGIFKNI